MQRATIVHPACAPLLRAEATSQAANQKHGDM